MSRFIDYATAVMGMAEVLRAGVDSGVGPYAHSREMMLEALTLLMDAAASEGRAQAERLLDLTLDGLGVVRGRAC